MPLYDPSGYEPSEPKFKEKKEGKFKFKVKEVEKKEVNNKTVLNFILEVNDGSSTFEVRDGIFLTSAALWKMDSFMSALGLDFNKPPEDEKSFINYEGVAFFKLQKETASNGNRYLEVGYYIEQEGDPQPIVERFKTNEEEIPF
jgi:hypothetical protein